MNQDSSNSSRPLGSEAPWITPSNETDDNEVVDDNEAASPPLSDEAAADPDDKSDSGAVDKRPEDKRHAGRKPDSLGFGRTQCLKAKGLADSQHRRMVSSYSAISTR